MTIELDIREAKLVSILGSDNVFVKQLTLGDVNIIVDETVKAIIERKTVADLAASLKDGRWKEQKLRLLQEKQRSGALIVYIIEGRTLNFNEEGTLYGVSNKALVTMVLNAMFRDRINIVFTQTIVDTADFIKGFAKRILDPACEWMHGRMDICMEEHQDAIIKAKRRDNITKDTVFVMQLCAIPGISTKKAQAIIDTLKVHNITALVTSLSECNGEKEMLQRLGTVSGIGKVLARDIVLHLGLQKNETCTDI